MLIRPLEAADYEPLLRLYRRQTAGLPFHHNVRRDQFRQDLLTTRFIRNPADHHPKARVALVAVENEQVRALVSGGLVTNGDEVVESGTGYIQAILGEPAAAQAVRELVSRVVKHIRRYRPKKIIAQDGCLSTVFFADSASTLPSQSAWIGQLLIDSGFTVHERIQRLVASLDKPRPKVAAPNDLIFYHVKHEMFGVDPKYDFGCVLLKPPYQYGDGVAWCGNFYSGAFVKGTSFRSLYINWFTIMDQAYRGQGLGRLILQHCLHEAQQRGAQYASLLTHDDNFIARNLYASEGFQLVDSTHSFELPKSRRAS